MISYKRLEDQLKRINFHYKGWGRSEICELCNVLMADEEIEECVNGYYEAGFALLVATKDRLLLIDKKPLNYLTIEDMRFDMINEFDYSHRLFGAQIKVSAGYKTLHFTSLNQVRLRRLLNYVQARMTQVKKDISQKQDTQQRHLEQMNEQLRLYLQAANLQLTRGQQPVPIDEAVQPSAAPSIEPAQLRAPQPSTPEPAADVRPAPTIPNPPNPQPAPANSSLSSFEQAAAAAFGTHPDQLKQPSVGPPQEEQSSQAISKKSVIPRYSYQALHHAEQIVLTPQQLGLAAARRVIPIISAYSRLPLISQRRRFSEQRRQQLQT